MGSLHGFDTTEFALTALHPHLPRPIPRSTRGATRGLLSPVRDDRLPPRRIRPGRQTSRWALLAETDRTLRAVGAERARVVRLREAEGSDAAARRAEPAIVRPRRLSLLGSVRRFSSERRSH